MKPVIGLFSAPEGFRCQSRVLQAGGTFWIPGCKDNGFFLSGKFLPRKTVSKNSPLRMAVNPPVFLRSFPKPDFTTDQVVLSVNRNDRLPQQFTA